MQPHMRNIDEIAARRYMRRHDRDAHSHTAPPWPLAGRGGRARLIVAFDRHLRPRITRRISPEIRRGIRFSRRHLLRRGLGHVQDGENRRARRFRLHRIGMRAPAAAPSAGRNRAAHRRPQGRAGDARGVRAILAVQAAQARSARRPRLAGARPRPRVLRAAPCHHPEGDQGAVCEGAGHEGGGPLRRLPPRRHRRLCALVRRRPSRTGASGRSGLWPRRDPP